MVVIFWCSVYYLVISALVGWIYYCYSDSSALSALIGFWWPILLIKALYRSLIDALRS